MKLSFMLRYTAAALACAGMLVPHGVLAETRLPADANSENIASQQASPRLIRDVALAQGGTLRGQLVDSNGQSLELTEVKLVQNNRIVASTHTDAQGTFQLDGLRGGVYQVHTDLPVGVFRLWAPQTAPPAAQASVLVIDGNQTIRGQKPLRGRLISWLTNPWLIASGVAAAIAIPLALDDEDAS